MTHIFFYWSYGYNTTLVDIPFNQAFGLMYDIKWLVYKIRQFSFSRYIGNNKWKLIPCWSLWFYSPCQKPTHFWGSIQTTLKNWSREIFFSSKSFSSHLIKFTVFFLSFFLSVPDFVKSISKWPDTNRWYFKISHWITSSVLYVCVLLHLP